MTWKPVLLQVLVTTILLCKVSREAECVAVTTAPKSKATPSKVFVTEIDASKFFKHPYSCSVIYYVGPEDRAKEEREKKEEESQKKLERKEEETQRKIERKEEESQRRLERKIDHEEHEKERREERREKWNEMLENLKQ